MTLVPPTSRGLASGANVTPVNSLVGGLAGQVLGGVGPSYAYPPGYEIDYVQITAGVNIVAATEAAGTTIITSNAVTFDGTPVVCEFFAEQVLVQTGAAGNFMIIALFEGATEITRLAIVKQPSNTQQMGIPVSARYRFTPSAGVHTYIVSASVSNTTGTPTVKAGSGGTAGEAPAFLRFVKG